MEPKLKERRRVVGRARGIRRLRVAVVLLALAALGAGYLVVRASDVFAVERAFIPESARVPEASLREALAPVLGVNLLRVSTGEIEERLRTLPYVRDAKVYRSFPDALEVHVTEYLPVCALVDADGAAWSIADDGRVLEKHAVIPDGLPIVKPAGVVKPRVGALAAPQVAVAASFASRMTRTGIWPSDRHLIRYLRVGETADLVLVLEDESEVRLGDTSKLEQKLMAALEVVERYSRDGKRLLYVDVSAPTRVVAKAR